MKASTLEMRDICRKRAQVSLNFHWILKGTMPGKEEQRMVSELHGFLSSPRAGRHLSSNQPGDRVFGWSFRVLSRKHKKSIHYRILEKRLIHRAQSTKQTWKGLKLSTSNLTAYQSKPQHLLKEQQTQTLRNVKYIMTWIK